MGWASVSTTSATLVSPPLLEVLMTLVETSKQNGVNLQRYLEDVLGCIQDDPANRLHELLPYHWHDPQLRPGQADGAPCLAGPR